MHLVERIRTSRSTSAYPRRAIDFSPLDRSLSPACYREGTWITTRTDGLRPIVENLDRAMSRLLARPGTGTTALLSSWAELVEFFALEPSPVLRECPICGSRGMRRAMRCGTCGKELAPSPPLASA